MFYRKIMMIPLAAAIFLGCAAQKSTVLPVTTEQEKKTEGIKEDKTKKEKPVIMEEIVTKWKEKAGNMTELVKGYLKTKEGETLKDPSVNIKMTVVDVKEAGRLKIAKEKSNFELKRIYRGDLNGNDVYFGFYSDMADRECFNISIYLKEKDACRLLLDITDENNIFYNYQIKKYGVKLEDMIYTEFGSCSCNKYVNIYKLTKENELKSVFFGGGDETEYVYADLDGDDITDIIQKEIVVGTPEDLKTLISAKNEKIKEEDMPSLFNRFVFFKWNGDKFAEDGCLYE